MREGNCVLAAGATGNAAACAAALCKLEKPRWRVCHKFKTRCGRLQHRGATAVSYCSRLSRNDALESAGTGRPSTQNLKSRASADQVARRLPLQGVGLDHGARRLSLRTSPEPSSRRACRMPERGTTGPVNRQHVLIRGQGPEWQRPNPARLLNIQAIVTMR